MNAEMNRISESSKEIEIHQKIDDLILKLDNISEKKINTSFEKIDDCENYQLDRPYIYEKKAISGFETKDMNDFIRNNTSVKNGFFSATDKTNTNSKSVSDEIAERINLLSPIRKLATVEKTNANFLEVVISENNLESGWVLAEDERKEGGNAVKLKKILTHEIYAQPITTKRIVEDSSIDVAKWLTERLVELFIASENHAFINGDGAKMPFGILSSEAKVNILKTKEDDIILLTDIMDMINSLSQKYLGNATFLMHRMTLSYVQTMRDENGRFIWQPGTSSEYKDTLFGIPIVCSDDVPTLQSSNPFIILADFKSAYKIVEKEGVYVMQDPYTTKHLVKFYATRRVGGDIVDEKAIVVMKNKNEEKR